MRRTLAGLLFGLAYMFAGIALSGWMLQRSAFDPERSEDLADVVLADDDIRADLADRIGDAAAAQLGLPPQQVRATVDAVTSTEPGADLLSSVIGDAHARLIGSSDRPVQITGRQIGDVVRDDRAAVLPPITLPVPKVGILSTTRSILGWLVPLSALAAILFAAVGFSAHPERASLIRSLALGLVVFAVLVTLLGYVLPAFLVPALSDNVWANAPARVAEHTLPTIIAIDILLVGLAIALVTATAVLGRRRRWTAPVSGYRNYGEQRRWG